MREFLWKLILTGTVFSNIILPITGLAAPVLSTSTSTTTTMAPRKEIKINIVASFSIIENLVAQIGTDQVSITSLIEREGEAHDFEPRAKHILMLKNADLFIYNGLNFEPWADNLLKQNRYTGAKLNLGEALQLPLKDQNPHIWQDPELLLKYVNLIKEALIKIKPEAKDIFEKNSQALTTDIREIHLGFLEKLKKLPQPRWLVTPHNGFYHLAKAYGFEYIYLSKSDHNENLSAKKIRLLIEQIKPLKNILIFDEWGFKSALLNTIQKETQKANCGFLIGDSLTKENGPGANIQEYLKYNNEALLKGFGI
jgi:ABC-type Zn uptake system ZnuABC Zn-binding protein ZnuA